MNQWKDTSHYRQSDTDRTSNEFRLQAGRFTLIVHRHIYYPGTWLVSCSGVFEKVDLKTDDVDSAKNRAVALLRKEFSQALMEL